MKKLIALLLTLLMVFSLAACTVDLDDSSQGSGTVDNAEPAVNNKLGNYQIDIKGCRLAEDYEGKPIVIITYGFTNNNDDATAFYLAVTDEVFQNGIGLNKCYFADDSAKYNSDNQNKEIKKGATLDVEVAYELNDTTTDLEVEVSEFISFSDKKLTKTFKISE